MTYDNTNRGAFFKNEEKDSDTQPDYKGNLNVGGVEYWIDGWINTAESGRKYMSLKVKPKEAKKTVKPQRNEPQRRGRDDDDSSIPF